MPKNMVLTTHQPGYKCYIRKGEGKNSSPKIPANQFPSSYDRIKHNCGYSFPVEMTENCCRSGFCPLPNQNLPSHRSFPSTAVPLQNHSTVKYHLPTSKGLHMNKYRITHLSSKNDLSPRQHQHEQKTSHPTRAQTAGAGSIYREYRTEVAQKNTHQLQLDDPVAHENLRAQRRMTTSTHFKSWLQMYHSSAGFGGRRTQLHAHNDRSPYDPQAG